MKQFKKTKQLRRMFTALGLISLLIVPQTGCGVKEPVSGTDFLLNTVCTITLYDVGDQDLIDQTFALCRDYENRLSRTIKGSDIDRINAAKGQPVSVDPTTAQVISAGIQYGKLSLGLFDITVGELSELWNFTAEQPSVPDEAAISEAVKHVNYEGIRLTSETPVEVLLADGKAKLDLGGIAKGYIADQAGEYLKSKGVTSAILDFGGNIVCIGEKKEGVPFTIGIERPFSDGEGKEKEILGAVEIKDKSVVTSGTYERKFVENGKLYYHILDPKTGYPRETDLDGVTIIGAASTDCDALSTTCLMLGLEKGKALIESLEAYEAVFVCKDGRVIETEGLTLIKRGL